MSISINFASLDFIDALPSRQYNLAIPADAMESQKHARPADETSWNSSEVDRAAAEMSHRDNGPVGCWAACSVLSS